MCDSVIPKGVIPYISVTDAAKAIDWYMANLGAKETPQGRILTPEKKIMHCELIINDGMVYIADQMDPNAKSSTSPTPVSGVTLHVYLDDVDDVWNMCVKNGATVLMKLEDQFWGDRWGLLMDPFGIRWGFSKHLETKKEPKEEKAEEKVETVRKPKAKPAAKASGCGTKKGRCCK